MITNAEHIRVGQYAHHIQAHSETKFISLGTENKRGTHEDYRAIVCQKKKNTSMYNV